MLFTQLTPFIQKRWFIILEFLLLCMVLPAIIIIERLAPYMFIFLWGTTFYCLLIYWLLPKEDTTPTWRWSEVNKANMKAILMRFTISSVLMFAFISFYDPARRFELLNNKQNIWLMVMLFYPVLSALPQEFIFCTFFFRRYRLLFRSTKMCIAASTIVFAYAHVLFINPVAPLLCIIAGYFFASTYAKHRSLALVTIEHALYGNMIFTLGLGWYFYGGAVGMP